MMNDVLFILLLAFVIILITIASIYFVTFVFLGDFKFTNFVIYDSLKHCLLKQQREERQKQLALVMNRILKEEAQRIVELPDKKLANSLDIDIDKAKKFKKNITSLLKKSDFCFISLSDVEEYDKINKTYNFINLTILQIKFLSNPKVQAFIKLVINYMDDVIDEKTFQKEASQIFDDYNFAKLKLKEMRHKNHANLNFYNFIFGVYKDYISKYFNSDSGLKLLYKKIGFA